jgi:hypothetical protein
LKLTAIRWIESQDLITVLIPVGFPLGPIEWSELGLLRTLADAPDRGMGLRPIRSGSGRDNADDLLAGTGDGDFLALFGPIEWLAELVFRLKGANLGHRASLSRGLAQASRHGGIDGRFRLDAGHISSNALARAHSAPTM